MIKLIDTNRYELKGTDGRWIHLATMHDGLHEYMCMYDLQQSKCYIEEISGGTLKFIEDEKIAIELADFLREHNITNPKYGLPLADKT